MGRLKVYPAQFEPGQHTNMKRSTSKLLQLELIWWLLTLILTAILILPIWSQSPNYPFFWLHLLYIVTFVTLTRYLFFLRHTFLAYRQVLKLILFFLLLPFVFYLIQELNFFQTFLDQEGPEALLGYPKGAINQPMVAYARNQVLFFGTGAIIAAVLFGFRMIISIWRNRNRGTV